MLRTLMQHEVTTNQALTPLHGRPRAPAAALRHAQAQEATLLLAALCSAASEQRRTRRTHGVLSQPRGGGRPGEREPRESPCPAHRRASGTKECKSRMLLRNGFPFLFSLQPPLFSSLFSRENSVEIVKFWALSRV